MESYEQKYKAALEWMKGLYGGLHGKTKEEAEKYFPELAESEDERIRKAIIATIHLYYGEPLEDEAKDMIAWLEKQGEQETDEWKEGNIIRHGGILALVIRGRRVMKSNGDIFTVQYPDEWVKAAPKEIEHFLNEFEKQAPKPMWAEEDEELLQHCCGAVAAADYYKMEDKEEMQKWLVSLKQRMEEQRATEYAEAIAASHVSSQFQSSAARKYASYLFYERETRQAYIQGATDILDEIKTVLSVSEDKYLRENINKMIKYLEGEK